MWNRRFFWGAVAAMSLAQGDLMAADVPGKDIVTTAVEAGSFKTLAAALKAGGLVETLQGKGPFTVFAPTDEAFAKLPAGTVESLLKPENKEKLAAILKFHVVADRVSSNEVLSKKELKTVQGGTLTAAMKNGAETINGVKLLTTDIDASNGVIHVIDGVMLPPAATVKTSHIMPSQPTIVSNACPTSGRVTYPLVQTRHFRR